jgi:hypothetical protein
MDAVAACSRSNKMDAVAASSSTTSSSMRLVPPCKFSVSVPAPDTSYSSSSSSSSESDTNPAQLLVNQVRPCRVAISMPPSVDPPPANAKPEMVCRFEELEDRHWNTGGPLWRKDNRIKRLELDNIKQRMLVRYWRGGFKKTEAELKELESKHKAVSFHSKYAS